MKVFVLFVLGCFIPSIHPKIFESAAKFVKTGAYEIIEKTVKDTPCSRDLKIFVKDLIHRKKWAFEMLDASGKMQSGMLRLNFFVNGNFDQCLDIHVEKNETVIDGQYCTVTLSPSSDYSNDVTQLLDSVAFVDYVGINIQHHTQNVIKMLKMIQGLCLPASCNIGNLQSLWNYVEHTFRIPLHLSFVDTLCRSKDRPISPYPIDPYIISLFGMYALLLLVSTMYDVFVYQNSNGNGSFLMAFSFYTNSKRLFSYTNDSEDKKSLKCISGIKVISILWIIWGHRFLINMFSPNINSKYIFEWTKHIESVFVFGAPFAVDTFFALSGFLLSYAVLKNEVLIEKKGMPIGVLYAYRILRLSPALIAGVGFYISIYKHLGDGPLWPLVISKLSASCYHFWWGTFFFISNVLPINCQCIEQSWYVSVDTQLFVISPFIMKYMMKYPRKTISACIVACIVSAVYSYILTIQNNFGAIFYEGDKVFYQRIYGSTFVRMPAYLIGLIMGYVSFKYRQISIPKYWNILLWIFSLGALIFLTLINLYFTRYSYSPIRSGLYNSCARPLWALAVSLIVLLCSSGHGGVINKFLSLPVFHVLVRLTYSIFLVHFGVLFFLSGQKKYVGYFSNLTSIQDYVADLFFTFLVATVWCLAFETPFMNIRKFFMQKGLSDPEEKKALVVRKQGSKKKRSKKFREICAYNYENIKEKKFE